MSDGRRPFWEVGLQTLAVVLVPLTIAGMGWYWTRWQQNVNDLKGMIDLVTDPSPEKQKYGIAMFEYLAKNGKVPVEFLAAQIDYATSAENPELLPMLEVAILNASRENPALADAYRAALDRRPSRVFVHVPDDRVYACLVKLRDSLKDDDKAANPSNYAMMTISEGATLAGGEMIQAGDEDAYGHRKLGGIGQLTSALLKERTGSDTIYQQLGYLMRSGSPDSLDLMVAINYAVMAADLAIEGVQGRLVALRNGNYVNVPISVLGQGVKRVDVDALYDRESYRPKIQHVDGKPMFLY